LIKHKNIQPLVFTDYNVSIFILRYAWKTSP